jgi:hypothetical protein
MSFFDAVQRSVSQGMSGKDSHIYRTWIEKRNIVTEEDKC